MSVYLSPIFGAAGQVFDNDGVPLSGGKIYTYLAGTTTPQSTYTTSAGNVAHSNPIVLDAFGRVPTGEIWLTNLVSYKFTVKDASENLIGTYDNIQGINSILLDAENVTYTPPYSGSVTTNVEATLAQTVSVKDFGAVGDGSDATTAINSAIASGAKRIYFPKGSYAYTGQLSLPTGMTLCGDGMLTSVLSISYAGFGVKINGDGGLIQDMRFSFSQSGFDFSTATANTTINTIDRCYINGPGAGATKTSNSYVGVRFQTPQGSPARVCYFNNVTNCDLTGFNKLFDFEDGANANFCDNNNLNGYWYGYYVRSLENRITGGFVNNVAGTSPSQLTVAYYLTSTATRNVIEAAVGEPGDYSMGYYVENGATLNYINMPSSNYAYGNANLANGQNWFPGQLVQQKAYYNLVENNYYTLKIINTLTEPYANIEISLAYNAYNDALPTSANGTAKFRLALNAVGTITAQMLSFTYYANAPAPVFTGIYIDGSKNVYLVFYHKNNGTATTEGVLNLQMTQLAKGTSATLPATISAGSLSNPTTTPVLANSITYDAASIANGASVSFNVTVTGAKLTNMVFVSAGISLSGLTMTAYVSATDTVTIVLANQTGGAVDLASTTYYVYVQPLPIF